MDGMNCEWCSNAEGPFEQDHGLPKSVVSRFQGGCEDPANKWRLCLRCHNFKTIHVDAELLAASWFWDRHARWHYEKARNVGNYRDTSYMDVRRHLFIAADIADWVERALYFNLPPTRLESFCSILTTTMSLLVQEWLWHAERIREWAKMSNGDGSLAQMCDAAQLATPDWVM